jgi:signal transduction histidine kinase
MPRTPGGLLAWARSLRGRLLLTYALLLAALLLILGLVLSAVLARVLYTEELARVDSEAKTTVAIEQSAFDQLVNGRVSESCAGAVDYQQAFEQTIAYHLASLHPGTEGVYLLDRTGAVLAPETAAVPVGALGPHVQLARLAALARAVVVAGDPQKTGSIASVSYPATDAEGQPIGVVLVAERYHTASTCIDPRNGALGVVEVVTRFPRVQSILAALRLLLALALVTALVVGIAIGGPLASRALSPLTRMTEAARRLAQGDLAHRLRLPDRGDEIGQLAQSFDEMAARIERAFAAQQASEERMRQFIADASHELRTPLTAIRGYTDVLLRGAKDDPETAEQVLLATRREAERMSRLVNDLLTLARMDAGRPLDRQPVDLIGLAGEAVDQARILAGEREVTLRTDGAGRLMVLADPDRLKQVLLILLDNALKYGRPAPDGWVHVEIWRTPQGAHVRVVDNGEGIAPEELPHIFDRFYRAQAAARHRQGGAGAYPTGGVTDNTPRRTSPRDGTGLGLAIAQAIVRAHGGTILAQSQPGSGTTFTITLPPSPPAADTSPTYMRAPHG